MTSVDLVRIVLRRWYAMVLGAVASLAVLYLALQQPPVFFTQFDVVLLPPQEATRPNSLQDTSYAMTPMAGLLVSRYNGNDRPIELASAGTTLYGEGIHAGNRVRLRNWGTQWQPIYKAPVIDVQVVAEDAGVVLAESRRIEEELGSSLEQLQRDQGVAPASRMTLRGSPTDPVVRQIGGSRSRAAVAIAISGAVATTIVTVLLDRRWGRRRSGQLNVRATEEVP